MHKTQPLTIGSHLLTAIERFGQTDDLPSTFELGRLKREADKLLKANALDAYVVKAGIAALEWDAGAVAEHTDRALRLGSGAATYLNCALSLRFVGNIGSAADLMDKAAQRYPLDSVVLKAAVDLLVSAGRLHDAAKICQGMVDRSLPRVEFVESTIHVAAKAHQLGITDETMIAQAGFAFDVLAAHRRRLREYTVSVLHDPDGSEVLVCSIQFMGTALEEMRMESELACRLAELPDWDPCVFSMELSAIPFQHADLAV